MMQESDSISEAQSILRESRSAEVFLPSQEIGRLMQYSLERIYSPVVGLRTDDFRRTVAGDTFMSRLADRIIFAYREHAGEGAMPIRFRMQEVRMLKADIETQKEFSSSPLVADVEDIVNRLDQILGSVLEK